MTTIHDMLETGAMREQTKKRLDAVTQHMNRCVHFTGLVNPACKAGVSYESVRETVTDEARAAGIRFALPCFGIEGCGSCALATFPTREEAEAWHREIIAETEQIATARRRIVAATGGKRGVAGSVECPKCGKRLGYSVAGFNGHIHARCETPDCLAWME